MAFLLAAIEAVERRTNAHQLDFSERAARSELYAPQKGERISYLIVRREQQEGEKRLKLITCVASLEEFLTDKNLRVYFNYYVSDENASVIQNAFNFIQIFRTIR